MNGASLQPGFRFSPTDEILVEYYLKRKVKGLDIGVELIPVVHLYKFDPWELPDKTILPKCDMEWFFFIPRERKYPYRETSYRPTPSGYWKATAGMDDKVVCQSSVVAYRKFLTFYVGKTPLGNKTNWVMHEYHLCDHDSQGSPTFQGSFAVCRLINKNEQAQKTADVHGYPKEKQVGGSSSTGSLIPTKNSSEPLIVPDDTPCQASENNEPASMGSNPSDLWDFLLDSTKECPQGQGLSGYFPNYKSSNSLSQPYSQYELSSNSSYSSFREEIESADDLSLFGCMPPYWEQGNDMGFYEEDLQMIRKKGAFGYRRTRFLHRIRKQICERV